MSTQPQTAVWAVFRASDGSCVGQTNDENAAGWFQRGGYIVMNYSENVNEVFGEQ